MANKVYVKHLQVVDSTNRYIREEAAHLWSTAPNAQALVVVSESQTAGRGQQGNVWHSQQGANLLLSILIHPTFLSASRQFVLSEAVALAIHRTLLFYKINSQLKWPNDIYIGNRKLAGVLVELDYSGCNVEQAIIGIGLNVNQEVFPTMDKLPVSMKILLGRPIEKDELLDTLLNSFIYFYEKLNTNEFDYIHSSYKRLLLGIGEKRLYIDANGPFESVIEDVEPDGHLLVRRSNGTLCRYAFKEIQQII